MISQEPRHVTVVARSAATLSLGLLLAACSGAASTGPSPDSRSSASAAPEVLKRLASASADQTGWPGPDAPITAPSGRRIVAITCGSQGYGCVQGAQGVKDAGKALGWDVTVVDGKGDPSVWNAAVTQAVSDSADGIVLSAVNPALVSDGLARAKRAGIPVVSLFIPRLSGAPVVDAYVSTDHESGGKALADWVIADSGGDAHVLVLSEPAFPELVRRGKGFTSELAAECPDCTIADTVDFSIGTMASDLPSLVTTALQSDPTINYVLAPFDSSATFASQGIRQSGRADVALVSGEGDPDGLQRVRDGAQAVDLATVPAMAGWAAVDDLARLFGGKPIDDNLLPQRLITREDMPSKTGGWAGDVDYKGTYRKLWGK
jgi:ribose transport system substrate-binding protein